MHVITEEDRRIKNEQLGNGIPGHTGLSWLFCLNGVLASLTAYEVNAEEKRILQGLARKVARLADLPVMEERKKLWKDHLSLKQTRPVIFIDPEQAWFEILPHTVLRCRNALARVWEYRLLKEIYWQENIGDDRVCRKEFSVQDIARMGDFGLPIVRTGGGGGKAYHIEASVKDYDEDLGKLHFRSLTVDREASARIREIAHDVFDGILTVKTENAWWYSAGLTVDLIGLRGYENFMYDIYDYPDELKALMGFLRDDWLNMLSRLEKENLLSLNNAGEFMGTGGYGWCDDLPSTGFDAEHVRPIDMWGYCESQESVSIAPDAWEEFVLPYQIPIMEKFGLNSYGCCEPLDPWIDVLKKKVPRLRKVTVSPWSDVRTMAEKLGPDYVYCRKMSAAYLAVPEINEEEIRRQMREAFAVTGEYGCPTEVLNRDIQTLAWNPYNVRRWVEIAREEGEKSVNRDVPC